MREEFQCETGVKVYDWDYIEKHSSLPLLISLAELKCAPSNFPSSPGENRLRKMVRLHIPSVKEEFERKRVDIRYAITQKGFVRDRTKHLPEIPSAPTSFGQPTPRTCGALVLDLEYACASSAGVESDENGTTNETSKEDAKEDSLKISDSSHDNVCQGPALYKKDANEKMSDDGVTVKDKDEGIKEEDGDSSSVATFDGESEEESLHEDDDDEYEASSIEESDDDLIEY